jgi:hypothetical protein
MKIILAHFILRSLGDIADKLGNLFPRYYANTFNESTKSYECRIDSTTPEMHPFRWVLTRQIGILLWFTGEICADWYPLLRTKAVVKNKSIRLVYCACAIFNISKFSIIICHFCVPPTALYDKDGVYRKKHMNEFYFYYWVIHLIIIYSSVLYDISVYYVLKKNVFKITNSNYGFLKKFKTISEYRILISSLVNMFFLPIVSITIIAKFYYLIIDNYQDLNFSFDEIRVSVANIPYYMIFIDQIFLLHSKHAQSSAENYNKSGGNLTSMNKSNLGVKLSNKYLYTSINDSNTLLNHNRSPSGFSYYSQNSGSGNFKGILSNNSNFNPLSEKNKGNLFFNANPTTKMSFGTNSMNDINMGESNNKSSKSKKNLNYYDSYTGYNNSQTNSWNILK